MERAYTFLRVQYGWLGLVGNPVGIERVYLPMPEKGELQKEILADFPGCREGGEFLAGAREELREYFEGCRRRFFFRLDLSAATPFQKKVYNVMAAIPWGEVHTYRWLAERIGNPKALRAVGGANGKNRWPLVIPCHRIVGSDGCLTGFSAHGGLDLKAWLLRLEGVPVEKGRVKVSF